MAQKLEKMTEFMAYGTHLRVHSESYQMDTNMTGFGWSSKSLHPCALGHISLSIGRVKLPSTPSFPYHTCHPLPYLLRTRT